MARSLINSAIDPDDQASSRRLQTMTGSMLITNYLREKTLLTLNEKATAQPSDNALSDAKVALRLEKNSRSPLEGNIKFLSAWIKTYEAEESVKEELISFNSSAVTEKEIKEETTNA